MTRMGLNSLIIKMIFVLSVVIFSQYGNADAMALNRIRMVSFGLPEGQESIGELIRRLSPGL